MADRNRMSIDDLWALQRIGVPTLSPDGQRACVAVTRYDMEENKGRTRLHLLSIGGDRARVLTRGENDTDPQWSPDGEWIAFAGKRGDDEEAQVYLISPDGGEAKRLTSIATGAGMLRWFPDGKRMAFISWVWPDLKGEKAQAARYKEHKEAKVKAHVSERMSYRYWDHWMTDGREPHVLCVDVATGRTRDLLHGTGLCLPIQDPAVEHFDLSPDGRELALTIDVADEPKWGNDFDIAVVNVGDRKPKWTNLTAGSKRSNSDPRYSPDGKSIAWLSADLRRSLDDQARLVVHDRSSGTRRTLLPRWDRRPAHIAWSPDSQALYFLAEDQARQPLWRIGLGERTAKKIAGEGTVQGFAQSADGSRIAFLRSTLATPPAVFACKPDGGEAVRIESLNDKLLGKLRLGAAKEFEIKGWGGESMHMWVVYPPEFDAKKKWPLLHLIHGGPHSAWPDFFHFRWNAHLFAAQGYVTVCANYHGSTGWGQAYIDSITGRFGQKEFADVEAATDFLLAQGYIDGERLFASGGSYGGYMVAYMNGHTTRYRAYVCHAGCYDWMSMMATDVFAYFDRELGAHHWNDEARVMKQSPHHYAGKFKTPTLVIHGELDYRVPATQGLQYFATLKTLEVPARLLHFPDENHWILKPQNARLWAREFLGWLQRWDVKKKQKQAAGGAEEVQRGP
jgi:dipeptidyl aminopeptidase/acylaminoacyl peptidase